MQISNDTNSILSSNLQSSNSDEIKEGKDRFEIFLENREKEKSENQKREELLADIEHIARTGFTKEQLERIKEILEELQKQRAESGQAPLSPEEYIQTLRQDLQTAIYEVTGKKVDLDDNMLQTVMNSKNSSNNFFSKATTDEELRLQDKLKKEFV